MENAIKSRAFPGGVIYAATRDSTYIFKAYGHHTYDSIRPTQTHDIFDLASITKVSAGILAIMHLYDKGLIDLDAPIQTYLKEYRWNRRGKSTIRELLTHSGGWQSWIKFYEDIPSKYFSEEKDQAFNFEIKEGLYLSNKSKKYILKKIRRCAYDPNKPYVYSDLFSYWIPSITERLTGTSYVEYLHVNIYQKLGLDSILYNPEEKYDKERIVPTEHDTYFREELIHGKVHDEGAILMHGISGHAGLFSTTKNLAILWHMLLNEGNWNEEVIFNPATLNLFTSYQFPSKDNRRGLGFDKPLVRYDPLKSSISSKTSRFSFGHTGFTGTMVWADPKYDLVFIVLTNRVYPSRNPNKMSELNVRPAVHDIIYTDYLRVPTYN